MSRCPFVALLLLIPGEVIGRAGELVEHRIELGEDASFVYVADDPRIPRPYVAHVKAPGGVPVTRNHPPKAGRDATDHDTIHPGLWLAFGDLNGADIWRNKTTFQRQDFHVDRLEGKGRLLDVVTYMDGPTTIAKENRTIDYLTSEAGYWILWTSTFSSERGLVFGDQEEMGLGVRLATPLTVQQGGKMTNSAGQVNEKGPSGVWGKVAAWIDGSAMVEGVRTGVLIVPDRRNVRPSYFHARDYGMMTANPFGEKAFTGAGDGTLRLGPETPLTLRFGVYVYRGEIDPEAQAASYQRIAEALSP